MVNLPMMVLIKLPIIKFTCLHHVTGYVCLIWHLDSPLTPNLFFLLPTDWNNFWCKTFDHCTLFFLLFLLFFFFVLKHETATFTQNLMMVIFFVGALAPSPPPPPKKKKPLKIASQPHPPRYPCASSCDHLAVLYGNMLDIPHKLCNQFFP